MDIGVVVPQERLASIVKLTSMSVIVIRVGMEHRALMALTSTRANVFLVTPDYIARRTSMNAHLILVRMEVFASIVLTVSVVSVHVATMMPDA